MNYSDFIVTIYPRCLVSSKHIFTLQWITVILLLLSQVFSILKTHLHTAMNYSDFIVTLPGV